MKKQIRLNAFAMNCVAHQSPGLWTHPRDRTLDYNRLPYWLDLAKTLERGRFDGLFLADVLGVYDVFGNSPDAALRNAAQTPANEPLMMIPAIDDVTEELISQHLYSRGQPDPDLIIRTAGDQRISNFLIWQASYAELYFTDTLWPDFSDADFDQAIRSFAGRSRRFGDVKSQTV